ncbi:hypothetical protein VNI00_010246 [Paramarasmius palmivorus]|uniref:Uncharacterized protein n=1 Tax=Paramarasmius palmivorus TaxID=297713 RepID=A0AAW0CJK9_9AGAR
MSDLKKTALSLKIGTASQFLLYGIYAEMLGICIYVLRKNVQRHYQRLIFVLLLLFLLISADVMLTVAYDILPAISRSSGHGTSSEKRLDIAHLSIVLVTNALADAILLYRCYIVWGGRWKVIVIPTLIYVASHVAASIVMGVLMTSALPTASWFNSVLKSFKELMWMDPAVRLYKLMYDTTGYLGSKSKRLYRMLITISLESGILYAGLLLFVFGWALSSNGLNISTELDACIRSWSIILGIMPTVIIFRVAIGVSFGDEKKDELT